MTVIRLWDPRFPGRAPLTLDLHDAIAAAAVRAGVAAPANPAEAGSLSAGGVLDAGTLVPAIIQTSGGAVFHVTVPKPVLTAAQALGLGTTAPRRARAPFFGSQSGWGSPLSTFGG